MFQSSVFDYVNVLDRAADASWMRNEAIGNNLSNVDTPGYKRQDVAFEDVLKNALGRSTYRSMDAKVSDVNLKRLVGQVYTDHAGYSYRVDGNNVDPDTEAVYLAKNQIVYQGLYQSVAQEFKNLQSVMK